MEDLEQLPYINGVIQETLRLYPPGTSVIREVMDDPLDLGDGIM
jgi:cytochrome P450